MNHVEAFLEFAEALHEPAFLLSGGGQVLGANRAGASLLGAGGVDGAALSGFVADPPEKLHRYLTACSRSRIPVIGRLHWVLAGGKEVEYRAEGALVRPKNGSDGAMLLVRLMPRSASTARFVALNRKIEALAKEIHERREAQEALRRSEARLEAILDNSATLISLKDPAGRYLLVNRQMEAVVGRSRREMLGRTDRDLFGDTLAAALEAHDRDVLEAQRPVEFETSLPVPEGNRTLLTVKFPVSSRDGVSGVCSIAADITERKRFEQQIQQTQKLESLGLLAGGVAHDFNNLLTGIMGSASLALEMAADEASIRPLLQDVVRAAERAAHLTRQMLAYAGKGKFVIERLDLSAQVRELAHLLRTSIPKKVELQLSLAPDVPAVEADPGQLQQLIMNLVINAAEAIGDKSGNVLVRTAAQQVEDGHARNGFLDDKLRPGLYARLEVSDTGCGMDSATLARIFDPFFTTKFTGRGLWLAATMGVVRSHNGAIKVSSEPGKGSTFVVLLPGVRTHAAGIASPPVVAEAPSLAGTILVADDEDVVRRTAKSMLERRGYRVLLAENGQEAVDVLRLWREQVVLVILDLTMPVMSGEQAFEHIKRIRADVPVLLSSGYNHSEAAKRFEGKPVAGFVQKPYTSARLLEAVTGALETGVRRKAAS